MATAVRWARERNLTRPANRETLIYILGRLSRGEELPSEILVLLAEHPDMAWAPRSSETH